MLLVAVGLMAVACDPPPPDADGQLTIVNGSPEEIVVTFDYGEPGHQPDLEEMWVRQRRIRSTPPDEASYQVKDTYLRSTPGEWCLPESEVVVVLGHVDGIAVDGTARPGEDSDFDASEFEILASYGPGLCVESATAQIVYTG